MRKFVTMEISPATKQTYSYVVNSDMEYPCMMLDKHIGWDDSEGMGIDGARFASELYALCDAGAKEITVKINSPGGQIMQGMQIYNAILEVPCKVNTMNIGIAASIAACIFQAGRKRYAYDYSLTMIHNAYDSKNGDTNKVIEKFNQAVCMMLARKTNKTETEIRSMMMRETWMTGAECLTMGFCDEIINSADINMPRKISAENKTAFEMYHHINNMLKVSENKPNQQIKTMQNLLNKFALPESATEAEVLSNIEAMENKFKAEIAAKTEAAEALQNKLNEVTTEFTNLKNAIETEKAEKLTAEATEFVNGLVNSGKIANDEEVKTLVCEQYKSNPENTKKVFGASAVNKSNGTSISVEASKVPAAGTFAQLALLDIQNKKN